MIQKYIIKRVGINQEEADPTWITEVVTIDKDKEVPDGYELINRSELKRELESQGLYQQYTRDVPSAPKDFDIPKNNLKGKAQKKDKSYKIYNYITSSVADTITDVEMPPFGIDYTINTDPKLRPARTFEKGFLTSVVWYAWDWNTNQAIEEILKVSIEYTVDENGSSMVSARQVLARKTTRQWMRQNGSYDESLRDLKITHKSYDSPIERNDEGLRRRSNIFVQLVNDYVTLIAILKTSGDIVQAQNIGQDFLSEISRDLSDYRSIGSENIINRVDYLADGSVANDEWGLNIVVPDIPQTQGTVPVAIGMKISDYINEIFKGNI